MKPHELRDRDYVYPGQTVIPLPLERSCFNCAHVEVGVVTRCLMFDDVIDDEATAAKLCEAFERGAERN